MNRLRAPTFFVLAGLVLTGGAAAQTADSSRLRLEGDAGTYRVFENRETGKGRTIELAIVVLRATGADPAADPIFFLHGGPGAAATTLAAGFTSSPLRARRDIVLVDQRGTGRSNPLRVELAGSAADPQGYLEPYFLVERFRAALPRLREVADLTRYTTPIAMDDLDDVRAALGYGKINLMGGSYGTRAALVYMRRHPGSVRTAVLNGVAPISFVNPLYHARAAEEGLERIFREVEEDAAYRKAFPDLREKFREVSARLRKEPAEVRAKSAATGRVVTLRMGYDAFAEGLRTLMYRTDTNRRVPLLLLKAHAGEYGPIATACVRQSRGLREMLAFGMLMSVTGSEDIPRIDPEAIARETGGTFLGDVRVRRQMEVAAIWPKGEVPDDYGEPVRSEAPVLLLSGTHDPVTPPRWGAEAAKHLENSLHLVVPGAHGVAGPEVDRILRAFLDAGTAEGLDTSALEAVTLPRFELPAPASEE